MKLKQTVFAGMAPRIEPHLLPESQSQDATNCKLVSGALQALYDSSIASSPAGASLVDLYNFDGIWLTFTARTSIVRAPVYNTDDRFYYTVSGLSPRKALKASYPTSFKMGVPKPTSIPTITLYTDPEGIGEDVQDDVSYVFCWVTGWGEQGPPSDPSAITTIMDNQYVGITAGITLPAGYSTDYNIVGYRLYRLSHGTTGSEYLQVYTAEWVDNAATGGHIPVSDLTPTDRDGSSYALIDGTNLGAALSSTGFQEPPATMDGLILLSNGVCAGFYGNEIALSEPFLPFAWNPDYALAVDYPIVALASYDTAIVVLTNAYPYIIDCYDPASATMKRINIPYPCASRDSVVSGNGLITYGSTSSYAGFTAYASTVGFIRISASGVQNLTDTLFADEQWQALSPSTMICKFYDNRFYFFSSAAKTGFIIDLSSEIGAYIPFVMANKVYGATVSVNPHGLYLLTKTDAGAFKIEKWEGASTRKTATYTSKLFKLSKPINFQCGRVTGAQTAVNTVTFQLYGDGALVYSKTVTDDDAFWLPSGKLYQEIEVKLATTAAKIASWEISTSIDELTIEG
ncbi:MAG: hypothetical protein RBT11_14185 [Desulfobacterales bacterium]|jgi:hypothetical protein|nr:hypothetical protein [Desulfobacterales bacterium]